jgi:hypothetical protein
MPVDDARWLRACLSIIGLAVFNRSALRAEAIGRCWSQGRLLAWLADS